MMDMMEKGTTWTISCVQKRWDDMYGVNLHKKGERLDRAETIIRHSELMWLCKGRFFRRIPILLVGVKINVPFLYINDPSEVLSYAVLDAKCDGEYTPPTVGELRKRTEAAFAKLQNPDLRDVDLASIAWAFRNIFNDLCSEKGFKDFARAVRRKSNYNLRVTPGISDEDRKWFTYRVRGSCLYFTIKSRRGKTRACVSLGPYSNPIHVGVKGR